MNDNHNEEVEHQIQDEQPQKLHPEHILEARISHALQKQAAHIQFSGELRNHIMQNLPSQHRTGQRRFLVPAFALAASAAHRLLSEYLSALKSATLHPLYLAPGHNGPSRTRAWGAASLVGPDRAAPRLPTGQSIWSYVHREHQRSFDQQRSGDALCTHGGMVARWD